MPRLRSAVWSTLALCALTLSLQAACGTRRDPDFCCTNATSCAASGVDVAVTACTDPAAPVCDDNGDNGPPRTCIADTGGSCAAPGDCMDPSRPYCIDNRCVQCQDDDAMGDCTNPTPACSATTHLCVPCGGPADCAGDPGGAICVGGSCVECADATNCPLATAGVCDPQTHACRGCVADDECASRVCNRDAGTCAAVADVLYVELTGTGTACTQAAPCGTLAQALAIPGDHTIRLGVGLHRGTATISGGRAITLHGAGVGQTTLDYFATVPGAPFLTVDSGGELTLEGLTLTGAPPSAPAVRCVDATVASYRVHVDGIAQGGFAITRCSFALVNTAITRCGSATSNFGAVSLFDLTSAQSVRFEFNTIIGNSASGANVAGVACAQLSRPVPLTSSIIFGNDRADSVPVGGDDDCTVTHSVIDVTPPAATNTDVAPGLTAPAFHLPAGSSAEGRADPAATTGYDIDGEPRVGSPHDSGADER